MQHALPHLRARALTSSGVSATCACATAASSGGLAKLRLDPLLVGLDQACADVLAQLLHAVEAGVDREVLVDGRELLELDLLDGDLERRSPPGQLLVAVVGRKRQLDRARLAGARSQQSLLEPRDQVAAAELDQLVAALATRQRLPRGARRSRRASEPT